MRGLVLSHRQKKEHKYPVSGVGLQKSCRKVSADADRIPWMPSCGNGTEKFRHVSLNGPGFPQPKTGDP